MPQSGAAERAKGTDIGTAQYATFYVHNLLFGIDVQKVQEIIRYQQITLVPCAPSVVEGLINLRGQIITAIDLRRRLGLPARETDKLPMNVVVHTADGVVSLLVDKIGDVLEAQKYRFEPAPDTLQGAFKDLVKGVFKLQDSLLLVLDTELVSEISSVI
jgi:purine-binding chemotaxis protein CheW